MYLWTFPELENLTSMAKVFFEMAPLAERNSAWIYLFGLCEAFLQI